MSRVTSRNRAARRDVARRRRRDALSPPSRFSRPPRRSLLILLGTQKRTTARPVVTPRSRRRLLGLRRIRPRVSASTGWTEPPGRRRRTDRRIVRVRRAVSRTAEHSAENSEANSFGFLRSTRGASFDRRARSSKVSARPSRRRGPRVSSPESARSRSPRSARFAGAGFSSFRRRKSRLRRRRAGYVAASRGHTEYLVSREKSTRWGSRAPVAGS